MHRKPQPPIEVPERQLRDILEDIVAASGSNTNARIAAFRWFNRLYYDVRKWNEQFIAFLETYPQKSRGSTKALDAFRQGLRQYRESLNERYGWVKNDLCTGLKMLSARFPKDFAWLYREDAYLYSQIREAVDRSYRTEGRVVDIADIACANLVQWLDRSSRGKTVQQRHQEVLETIHRYRERSLLEVQALHELAFQVGATLLSVEEYGHALRESGSGDVRVMVLGEVTMSGGDTIKNIGGVVVSKSVLKNVAMSVGSSTALPSKERDDLARLLAELDDALEPVRKAKPEAARRVERQAETVADEVTGGKADRSYLDITVQGLKQAAEAVKDIAPTVLEVAGRIVTFISTFGLS